MQHQMKIKTEEKSVQTLNVFFLSEVCLLLTWKPHPEHIHG